MSIHTPTEQRDIFIYQVFVRNHTEEGTFKALISDLERIASLGVDVLYLLPVHPIGEKQRKGSYGSPYSIKDYRDINDKLGTIDDFKTLIQKTHEHGMKIMMDIVFNHTSYDSVLFNEHPEWFYKENGQYTNRVGDWWDIVDFDYKDNQPLRDYLVETLEMYTKMGVDGYRFDVASFLPLDFLSEAKEAVKKIDPDTIWVSESVHGGFLRAFRNEGFEGLSEGEIYRVFDMAYDYDTQPALENYLKNDGPLQAYVDWLNLQEEIYPKNYIKMRNLENHDFGRFASMVENDETLLMNWHAFSFFSKGSTMLFAGGETLTDHHPNLFEKDTQKKGPKDISPMIRNLSKTVRGPLFTDGIYTIEKAEEGNVLIGSYTLENTYALGVFNVSKDTLQIKVPLLDGTYVNELDGSDVIVKNAMVGSEATPVILKTNTTNKRDTK
ncbi:MAG: alpha-amylase family glycosyl hydrolase [Bacillota bacterium]